MEVVQQHQNQFESEVPNATGPCSHRGGPFQSTLGPEKKRRRVGDLAPSLQVSNPSVAQAKKSKTTNHREWPTISANGWTQQRMLQHHHDVEPP